MRAHLSKNLKQGRSFTKLGPKRKIARLRNARVAPAVLGRLCADSSRANMLKQVRGSLPGSVSAFRCYLAFCQMRNLTPFPPTEDKAAHWSCAFNDNAAFGNYSSARGNGVAS